MIRIDRRLHRLSPRQHPAGHGGGPPSRPSGWPRCRRQYRPKPQPQPKPKRWVLRPRQLQLGHRRRFHFLRIRPEWEEPPNSVRRGCCDQRPRILHDEHLPASTSAERRALAREGPDGRWWRGASVGHSPHCPPRTFSSPFLDPNWHPHHHSQRRSASAARRR